MTGATIALMMTLTPILAYNHLIEYSKSRDEGTQVIKEHQKFMIDNWCREWRFADEWDEYNTIGGYYAQTLACVLADHNFECPCEPTKEWIPIAVHGRVDRLDNFKTSTCPNKIETDQVDHEKKHMYMELSEYLCKEATKDSWSKNAIYRVKYSKLISSSCILARKMFNCVCISQTEHLPIIFDGLTQRATREVGKTMMLNEQKCISMKTNKTSIYDLYFQDEKRLKRGSSIKISG